MSQNSKNQICRRCNRPVASANYEIFERMHYVCFHYAFEHGLSSQVDVDAECSAGGCASSSVQLRHASEPGGLEEGQLAFVGVTFLEERDGRALVRLPNGSKTTLRFGALNPHHGSDFHFVQSSYDDGERARCLICDWAEDLDSRVAAETAALAHRVRCPTETT